MKHPASLMTTLTLTTLCLAAISIIAHGQDAKVETVHVEGNIYMLIGNGGNIGVTTGEDGLLIIDDQYANMADPIRAALKKLSDDGLKFILNTHFHGDHTGGNVAFGREAPIIAHANVRARLVRGKDLSDPEVRQGLPTITFDESLSIHFNGEEIRAVHFSRGHTDTDSVIFFPESNVVHMGDHFFKGRFPYIDLGSGGDVSHYLQNVREIIELLPADVKIIPGHGPLADLDDLKEFADMIEESIEGVKKAMGSGVDLEAIKAKGPPKKYDGWGAGFVNNNRWLSTIHASLEREAKGASK